MSEYESAVSAAKYVNVSRAPRAKNVQDLREELAQAEAALATENARAALASSLNASIRLYGAAIHALSDVRAIECDHCSNNGTPREMYAEFRKELAELLAPFNYKIVLVGDKSKGCVVRG